MKHERVKFRSSHIEREQFEAAATILGVSLSAFLRLAALERSSEIIKSEQFLILSNTDRDIFLSALVNPPKANKHLKKAITEYKKYMTRDGIF